MEDNTYVRFIKRFGIEFIQKKKEEKIPLKRDSDRNFLFLIFSQKDTDFRKPNKTKQNKQKTTLTHLIIKQQNNNEVFRSREIETHYSQKKDNWINICLFNRTVAVRKHGNDNLNVIENVLLRIKVNSNMNRSFLPTDPYRRVKVTQLCPTL